MIQSIKIYYHNRCFLFNSNHSNLHLDIRYASRDYVIEEKNIEKVLDLVAKYNLYKFKS